MAAYGALVSLSHLLHRILNPPTLNRIIIDRQQAELLRRKVNSMIDFLETHHRSGRIEDLERKIADAAHEAEDIIESNVMDQIYGGIISRRRRRCAGSLGRLMLRFVSFIGSGQSCPIQTVLDKFLSIEKEMMKIKGGVEDRVLKSFTIATSSKWPLPRSKISMVGFNEHLNEIMDALASNESNRQIIPIVGMGGIGKTTLASAVYKNPFIIEHFHVFAWVSVSQEYIARVLLLRLLSEITKIDQSKRQGNDDEIGEVLYKELFGRKYLIVIDDMWDIEAWKEVKRFLPDNGNGSRILVTTRLSKLASDIGSCSPHQIGFLDEEKSWDLLCGMLFGNEGCPIELVETGKNIARKCKGLPLALVVVGGILSKCERTKEYWESVEGDVSGNDGEQSKEILSLSYNHLPVYLKPCFLYLAVFPEDYEIRVSWLTKLWVAEGLIKPTHEAKCLEEVAQEHIENLISRNPIFVCKRSKSGKVKCCKIHDLLRELSIALAEKEKFVYIVKLDNPSVSPDMETKRRLSVSSPCKPVEVTVKEALRTAKFNRSWLSHERFEWEPSNEWMINQINEFRLLTVAHLDGYTRSIRFERKRIYFDIYKHINLRYVVSRTASSVSSMSLCWNLQTLVLIDEIIAPTVDIWQMPQLRHLKMCGIILPNPPTDGQNVIVLNNLQTLEKIRDFECTEQVLERIPNLKKLHIVYFLSSRYIRVVRDYCLKNLECFRKLESLKIYGASCTGMALPISLTKLSLTSCKILWEDLFVVGSLPNLEVLSLSSLAPQFEEEWNPIEGQFCRLKFLMIYWCKINTWGAENYHFPCLEHLVLHGVMLKEIPLSFAEILTFNKIELRHVDESLWSYANEISEQRELLGYEPLQIREHIRVR